MDFSCRRRLLISSQENGFPSDYQKVEWLESSGTQYLDLGFKPNQDTRVLMDYQQTQYYNNPSGGVWLFGCRDGSSLNSYVFLIGSDGFYATPYRNTATSTTFTVRNLFVTNNTNRNVIYKARLNDGSKKMGTFNGDDILSRIRDGGDNYRNFSCAYNFLLFTGNNGTTIANKVSMKVFEFKVWNGETLSMDLMPCYRKSDNVAGMYDLVNGTFFTNQGTGNFTVGDDVN